MRRHKYAAAAFCAWAVVFLAYYVRTHPEILLPFLPPVGNLLPERIRLQLSLGFLPYTLSGLVLVAGATATGVLGGGSSESSDLEDKTGRGSRGKRWVWVLAALLPVLLIISTEAAVRLLLAAGGLALVVVSIAFGGRLLEVFGFRRNGCLAWEVALSGALGLGVISIVLFVLGCAGALGPVTTLAVLLAAAIFSAREIRRLPSQAAAWERRWRSASALPMFLLSVCCLLAAFRLLLAFVPHVQGSHLDYDVLEYHLACPVERLQAGRITFLPHNVFASFPELGETLYSAALSLVPGTERFSAAAAARIIHTFAGILAALGIYGIVRKKASRSAASFAASAFYSLLWVSDMACRAMVELFLVLYVVVALGLIISATEDKNGGSEKSGIRMYVLAGVLAGLAFGVKYTAGLFVCANLAAIVFFRELLRGRLRAGLGYAAAFSGACLLTASPWLIFNAVHTGNPFRPLLYGVFGGREWDMLRDVKFRGSVAPRGSIQAALTALARLVRGRRDGNIVHGYEAIRAGPVIALWLPMAVASCLRGGRVRRVVGASRAALTFFLVWLLFWLVTTHKPERFLFPAYAALAVSVGFGYEVFAASAKELSLSLSKRVGEVRRFFVRYSAAIAAAVPLLLYVPYSVAGPVELRGVSAFSVAFGATRPGKYLRIACGSAWKLVKRINRLPEDSRILLVGEAQTYYVERNVVYSTVYDEPPVCKIVRGARSVEEAAGRLRAAGITHVAVNRSEMSRLERTYSFEQNGVKHGGYLDFTKEELKLFEALLSSLKRVWHGTGKTRPVDGSEEGVAVYALLKVRELHREEEGG